jgi:hypothetical protein
VIRAASVSHQVTGNTLVRRAGSTAHHTHIRKAVSIMAKHTTHKATRDGRAATLARRQARAVKRGATVTNRSGRARAATHQDAR